MTFLNKFCLHELLSPKFDILVVITCKDLGLIFKKINDQILSKFWPNLAMIWSDWPKTSVSSLIGSYVARFKILWILKDVQKNWKNWWKKYFLAILRSHLKLLISFIKVCYSFRLLKRWANRIGKVMQINPFSERPQIKKTTTRIFHEKKFHEWKISWQKIPWLENFKTENF